MPMPKTVISLLATTLLLPAGLAARVGGQLPLDTALPNQRPIVVELDAATVQVVVDGTPTLKPWLRAATARDQADAAAGALIIDWQEGPTVVRRMDAPAAGEQPVPIVVELTVRAGQPLVIKGSDLDVTVTTAEQARARLEAAGQPTPTRPRPRQLTPMPPAPERESYRLEIEVASSRVDLAGVGEALLILDGSRLRSEGSKDFLRVEAKNASEAEILEHHGDLELVGASSDLAVQGVQGSVRFDLRQSQVILRDGRGAVAGEAAGDGTLAIYDQNGPVEIKGQKTTLELHGGASGRLDVDGDDLAVTLDGWHGTVKIGLRGGSLNARGWAGPSELTLAGTVAELEELRGPMVLETKADARVEVNGLQGLLSARVARSELDLHDISWLDLTAQNATITGGGVGQVRGFEVQSSRVDLDLSSTVGIFDVKLRRASRTDLRLHVPCVVMVDGTGARDVASQVTVDGCTLQIGYASPSELMGASQGRRSTLVRALVDGDAELDVAGITP